jgi:predicted nuclease of predicted toxin-antitoxin system
LKLLFDQNLSPRLIRALQDLYPGSLHVRDIGLEAVDDAVVWAYAAEHRLVIVSKDSDFHQRSFVFGYPPKVVWIRLGNCTTSAVEAVLRHHAENLEVFARDEAGAFLVLGDWGSP